jgi:heptosyltransferase I
LTDQPDSLCILRLSAIGDICHTVPVVNTLRAALPDTRITWVVGAVEATLVGDLPGIEFVVFDKGRGLAGLRDLRRRLGGRRFDVLLHMQAALRASIISRFINAGRRIGFDRRRARDGQWLFTNERIEPRERQHVMDGLFGFAEALGIHERHLVWDIPLSDADRDFAAEQVPARGGALALSPCASSTSRNWRAERYAEVADYAMERFGLQVVLTGGPSDVEKRIGNAVAAKMRHDCLNLIGQTSLKQLLAVLERCVCLVTPDSGPAHLGTAAGIPVLGLYAVSNPERAGPYFSRHWVVNRYPENVRRYFGKPVDAVPWGARVRLPDGMDIISADHVKEKLDALVVCHRGRAAS